MNKGQMEVSYEEIQMELDLRGSELGNDTVKESGKGQRLTELVVHRALGINSKASTEDNLNGFQPMTEDNEHEFNREEIAAWFRILSVRGRCPGLGERAEEYATKFVDEDEMNNGWLWLNVEKEYWLQNLKRAHYIVLEKYGFARKDTLSHWGTSVTPVKARDESATPVQARDESIPMQPTAKRDASVSFQTTPDMTTLGVIKSTPVNTEEKGNDFLIRRPPGAPIRASVEPVRNTSQMGGSPTIESELAKTLKQAMEEVTNRMWEQQQLANQSMKSFSDDARDDKPVQGIPILDPEFGYKIKVRDFVSWIKSVEDAWGKVSSTVTRALYALRKNLRSDKNSLLNMLTEKENQRLYISISDKVGGTIKERVWMSHHQDGIGYLLAVMKVAVEPDDKEWSERAHAFYKIPEILASQYQHLSTAFKFWLKAATEVMYSKRFTAEAVLQNLGEFLRHYPDILVMVNKTWNGSNQDYSNLEDIIVVLKQEVEKATIRMSTASKYKWGKELTVDDTVEGKGQDDKDKDKAKRTEFTDEERENW